MYRPHVQLTIDLSCVKFLEKLFEESDFIIIYAYSLFDPNYDVGHKVIIVNTIQISTNLNLLYTNDDIHILEFFIHI